MESQTIHRDISNRNVSYQVTRMNPLEQDLIST